MTDFAIAIERMDAASAGLDTVFASAYPEVKQIARAALARGPKGGGLETTAVVHEAYLRLAGQGSLAFASRLQFLAYASRALRHLVIDLVREQRAQRRGGGRDLLTLDTAVAEGLAPDLDVERLNEALEALGELDAPKARLVEMRFFGGLTAQEIAEVTGSSERSVQREWSKARGLLLTLLD